MLEDLLSNRACSSRTWIHHGPKVLSTVYLVWSHSALVFEPSCSIACESLNSQVVCGVGHRAYLLGFFESLHSKVLESSCSRLFALVLVFPLSWGGGRTRHKLCSPNHLKILCALWFVVSFHSILTHHNLI
ncbi:hypothetical protein Taro_038103 [Colocasia esculenta]|uniref:Uncharacterized protein n=1 Tax=Colocasia esculenta TaxID=4460 RepID=A0A843W7B6_COLES|nr:hypothetical protein [Colocasia esculenta]